MGTIVIRTRYAEGTESAEVATSGLACSPLVGLSSGRIKQKTMKLAFAAYPLSTQY